MKKNSRGKKPASKKKKTNAAKPAAAPAPSKAAPEIDDDYEEQLPPGVKPPKRVKTAKAAKNAKTKKAAEDRAARKAARHGREADGLDTSSTADASGISEARRAPRRGHAEDGLDTSSAKDARGISHEARRRRQMLRDALRIGSVLLVIALLAGCGYFLFRATTVERISITGSSVYGEAQILSLSGVHTGKSILFYNENEIRDDINSIPDLRVVSVSKEYPNSISVVVADITAYAAILSPNGVYTLISDEGYVLSMGEPSDRGLIRIEGMTGVGFALNTYIDRQNNTIRTVGAVRLLQAIEASPIAEHVRSIDMASSQYVSLSLDNDYTIVLGAVSTAPECIETACEAYERFLPVYPGGGTIQVFRGSSVVDFTPNK